MRLGLLLLPASAVATALPTKPDAFSPARHLRDLLPIRRLADVSCTILSDVDYAGNDIGSVAAAAAGDCCAKCGATSGCGAFTWTNWNGGTCWLKSKQGTATVSSGARSAVVATSTTPGLSCTIEAGVDYVGNDIANVPGAAPSDCCAKCKAQSGCNAFSWINYNGGTCYLKSSKGTTQQKADVYSGVVSSSGTAASCPTVQTDVNYVGNDVASVAGTGASDCCTKCAAQSGCGAFTWTNWNGGTCWLKSGKGATQASTGAISAVLSTSGPTCPNVEQGVDYVGNDVASVAGSGASDCCTKCAAQAGCGAFTWSDWNGGTCWLKSGKGTTKTTTGVVSAVLGGSSTPVTPPSTTPAPAPATCAGVESDVNYNGNDVGSAPAASASECCAKCGAFSGCFAFTWTNYNNGTCWLKSMKGESAIALGAISGYLPGAPTAAPVTLRPLTPRPTTSKPAPSSHVQWKLRAGVIPARSANLGGWLVGEYWMSYASPAWKGLDWNTSMSGEYYAMQKLGASVGTAQFEAHRQTWITESDIAAVAAAGLNCVRVPIGFWIVYDDPSIPPTAISKVYAPGSLKYLDTLINVWAVKYNIAVMISLHAHQGSQNGNDHSAPQVYSRKDWSTSQANVDNSLQFATFIAARYKNSEAFLGMNLMNEPSLPTSYDVLLGYYTEAYKRIRATGNDCIIVTSPMVEQQNADVMVNFMRPPEYYNVWHELHPYFKWGYEGYNEQQVIKAASGYRSNVLDKWVGNPLFLGEWSLGSPEESAPFKDRTLQKQYAAVQLANYEAATSGWSFWAWRNDQELNTTVNGILVGWSMRQLLQEGIFTVPRV